MLRLFIVVFLFCSAIPALSVVRVDSGKGQVLLYPFFTTENGWDTYINVVLLSETNDEVLKVRILDGVTGAVSNTFNIYSKVGENWRVALAQTELGEPFMRIGEGSCTVSEDGSFGGSGTDFPLDTSTGLVEIYRVTVRDAQANGVLSDFSCEELAQRWEMGGAWDADPMNGLVQVDSQPEIVGHFDLINVPLGLASEQPAIGLRDFTEVIPHTAPESSTPTLEDADPTARLESGEVVVPASGEGIDAIALLLSTGEEATITNDVVLVSSVAASTDWIVSFPLRGYKDYGAYEVEIDGEMRTCNENEVLGGASMPSIERSLTRIWASWGGFPAFRGTNVIDPAPPVNYSPILCYPVNVLTFGENAPVFLTSESPLHETISVDGPDLEIPSDSAEVAPKI